MFSEMRTCYPKYKLFEKVKLKPKTAKKLAPRSTHIKFAADKSCLTANRRRQLVQKGEGFQPFPRTSVLKQLANFLQWKMYVERLVLVPEHMVDQRRKPHVPALTAQANEIDSDLPDIIQRQDIIQRKMFQSTHRQANIYDQNLLSFLTNYNKRTD